MTIRQPGSSIRLRVVGAPVTAEAILILLYFGGYAALVAWLEALAIAPGFPVSRLPTRHDTIGRNSRDRRARRGAFFIARGESSGADNPACC